MSVMRVIEGVFRLRKDINFMNVKWCHVICREEVLLIFMLFACMR